MSREYESELTGTRDEIAAALRGLADGIAAGSVRIGNGDDAVSVDVPEEVDLEIELESGDGDLDVEVEIEMPKGETGSHDVEVGSETSEGTGRESEGEADGGSGEGPAPVGAAKPPETLARFELFRDRGGEWRWRLVHHNGNVVATSGEGYTRKHNARKGLRSVARNAPGAAVTEAFDG